MLLLVALGTQKDEVAFVVATSISEANFVMSFLSRRSAQLAWSTFCFPLLCQAGAYFMAALSMVAPIG